MTAYDTHLKDVFLMYAELDKYPEGASGRLEIKIKLLHLTAKSRELDAECNNGNNIYNPTVGTVTKKDSDEN